MGVCSPAMCKSNIVGDILTMTDKTAHNHLAEPETGVLEEVRNKARMEGRQDVGKTAVQVAASSLAQVYFAQPHGFA